MRHWLKCKPISKNWRQFIIGIFVYKKTVLNLDFICNFDNFRAMKQKRGVSNTLFKTDNSKSYFLENVEMVNCTDIVSPHDASIANMWFK